VRQEQRVREVLRLVRLEGFDARYPRQLSGGQQQRVAVARALAFHPRLLLMDEPLGALDSEFRHLMCGELRELHSRIDATTVYITHDQLEAMAMADRIAIMNQGRVEQTGTPQEIYDRALQSALAEADAQGARGRAVTPFLLARSFNSSLALL